MNAIVLVLATPHHQPGDLPVTTAAERDRRIAAATKRIAKATTKAAALRAEADTHDLLIARSREEIAWWEGAPIAEPPSQEAGQDPAPEINDSTGQDLA